MAGLLNRLRESQAKKGEPVAEPAAELPVPESSEDVPAVERMDYQNDLLLDIDFPEVRPRTGRTLTPTEREEWLSVTAEIMARGCDNISQMARLLGITRSTAAIWMRDVRERQAKIFAPGGRADLAGALFAEADAVAKAAFKTALKAEPRNKANLLKVVLEANKRKAALTGLDTIQVNHDHQHDVTGRLDVVVAVEDELQLPPGALEKIGVGLARQLTVTQARRLGMDAIDVPAVLSEPAKAGAAGVDGSGVDQ